MATEHQRDGFTEIAVRVSHDALEAVADSFISAGTGGVVHEEHNAPDEAVPTVWVKAYVAPDDDVDRVKTYLEERIAAFKETGLDPGPAEVVTRFVPNTDWANEWRKYYRVTRVGQRIVIRPTWEPYNEGPNDIVIDLDPGMAFGTGSHPTTTLCLESLEQIVQGGEAVADIGTGSGILAIAAAKLGAQRVDAIDIQEEAIEAATANARANGVDALVHVAAGTPESLVEKGAGPYDIIVMNIVADVIIPAISTLYKLVKPTGRVVLSGIIDHREDDVQAALRAQQFEMIERKQQDEWVLLQVVPISHTLSGG